MEVSCTMGLRCAAVGTRIVVKLPESVADALGMPQDRLAHELRKGLAVAMYAEERLPLSEAAKLAGMA